MNHTILRKAFSYSTLSTFGVLFVTLSAYAAPTISFTDNVAAGPVQSDTISISVSGVTWGSPTYRYAFSSNAVCNNADTYSNTFVPGTSFTINTETNNGAYICPRVVDASGTTYASASANDLNVDATAPAITITNNVSAGPVLSETAAATITDTNISLRQYSLSSDAVCNASDFPWTNYTSWSNITFNTEINNGKYVCFKWQDSAGNITYAVSANDINVNLAPVMSMVNDVSWSIVSSDTVNVTVSDSDIASLNYGFSSDTVCNGSNTYPNTYFMSRYCF